jgi:radical SAM protein with 4Fe4S-binding SPASM domain
MKRVVWDPGGDVTHLVDKSGFRVVSGEIGRILDALRHPDPHVRVTTREAYPAAVRALEQADMTSETGCRLVRIEQAPHLKRVQVEIGARCNLRCSYCFSSRGPEDGRRLPRQSVLDVIGECDRLGVLGLDLTGGEPLLDPDWELYVTTARSAGIAVFLQTNGTLVDERAVRVMETAGVAGVQVSLDSHTATVNDAGRGSEGALAAAFRGMELIHASSVPLQITLMTYGANAGHVVDSIRYLAARFRKAVINIDRVIALRPDPAVELLSAEEHWKALRPFLGRNVRTGKVCETPGMGPGEPQCGVGYSLVYITAEGEVAACPTMTGRESAELRGPSLDEGGLARAWYDSAFFARFRFTNCGVADRCEVGRQCGGGCRSNAYRDVGATDAPDVVECNLRRNATRTWIDFPRRYEQGVFDPVTG